MNVFVTGSTGFIGRRFVRRLLGSLGADDRVYLLERRPGAWSDPRIDVLVGDLEHVSEFESQLLLSAWVFHIGGNAAFAQGDVYERVNFEPVRQMLAILQRSTVLARFVFVSSIGALDRAPSDRVDAPLTVESSPNPTSDYGRSKMLAENALRDSGLPFTIVRPGWVYGGGMRRHSHMSVFADLVVARSVVNRLRFPARAPLIHVDDLCEALVTCMTSTAAAGRTYLAVTENRSLGEIFDLLQKRIAGTHRHGIPVPRLRFLTSRVHRWLPLALSSLFLDYLAAEDAAFRRDLLAKSAITLEEGIDDLVLSHPAVAGRWLVTGANSGIGRALVDALVKRGTPVIAVDRQVDTLESSDGVSVIEADLTDRAAVERTVLACEQWPLACLVNNAGVGHRGNFFEQEFDKVEAAVRVNVLGTLALTHALRKQVVRDGSVVVNVASSVAYHPLPHMAAYAASKAFILNWSLALAEELRPGNRVITFSPSGTRTNFQRVSGVRGADDPNLLSPDEVAAAILNAVKRSKLHTLMGLKSKLLVAGSRLLPAAARLRLWSRLFSARR